MGRQYLLAWHRPAGSWAAIVAMLLVAWSVTYAMGGSQSVAPHLFYLPVLFAAFRLRPPGAAIAAIAAGVFAGPLMPLSVEHGVAQPWLSWTARTGAFLLVGLLTAGMAGRLRAARAAEVAFSEERSKILQLVDHELRTPLTVIKGGARLLDASALPERVGPLVPAMEHAVARLEGLAATVAASVAEDEHDHRHDLRVDAVIASVLAALPREARSRVSVYGANVVVSTLRRPLKVAISCVLDNALRFSPDRPVIIRASEDEDGCHIAVRDLGPGVPPDRIEDLFEPFHQGDSSTTRRHDGLGLGLFAARRNVRHLGGELQLIAPEDGPGLVATITVPHEPAAPATTHTPERSDARPGRTVSASWRGRRPRRWADGLRLVGLLHRHERSLTERLQRDRPLAADVMNDHTATGEETRRIRTVLDQRAFGTVFQPIYSLDGGHLIAVEALTRFTADPQRPPDQWFDEAKRCGLGVELELATLGAALDATRDLLADGVALSVNISPATLNDPRLHQYLTTDRLPGLIIEITEHAAVDDYPALADTLAELTISGVRVAIDDAGAGFSSLQHVIQLQPDIIKLDMSLTRDIHIDPVRRALAASLIDFARQMGIELIAEGVETAEELDTLQQIGAHAAQGYLLAHPGDLPVPSEASHIGPTLRALACAR